MIAIDVFLENKTEIFILFNQKILDSNLLSLLNNKLLSNVILKSSRDDINFKLEINI